MNFIRKTLIWFFIVSLAIPSNFALAFSYPSPIQIMDKILADLGLEKDELKKNIDLMDQAHLKKNPPIVTLSFTPENPVPGKKLTVTAIPTYFIGNVEQMYYTWYLKRNNGEAASQDAQGRKTKNGNTDWNKDGDIDVEDYKIEAMRLVANGGLDPASFDYSKKSAEAEKEDGYQAYFGGEDQKGKPAHCYVRDIAQGTDIELSPCEHLFPNTNNHGNVGDGKFTLQEEKFWGTDPSSADTNNDGLRDEEALTGKGLLLFSWLYQEGDEIGVVTEGVLENTDYKDSSMKTMWAISGNPDIETGGGAVTANNINEALKKSFVKPVIGTAHKKIEVNLTYSPQYPVNDPTGKLATADTLTIKANLSNIEDKSFVRYNWTFFSCNSMEGTSCDPINKDELKSPLAAVAKGASQAKTPSDKDDMQLPRTIGLGLDAVKLKLKLKNVTHLKANVVANESGQQFDKKGEASIIIPLQNNSAAIVPRPVLLKKDSSVTAGVSLEQITTNNANRYGVPVLNDFCNGNTCPAVKNEIMGLYYNGAVEANTNLSWNLNGKPLITSENSTTAYFPILQNAGSKYSVQLNITKGKEKTTLTRDFQVESPKVEITPQNCAVGNAICWPAEIGQIIDPYNPDDESKRQTDLSQDIFQVKTDSMVTLKPTNFNFDAASSGNDEDWQYTWFVDGVKVLPTDVAPLPNINLTTRELYIPINKPAGEKYKLALEFFYTQPAINKKALYEIWGVPKNSFYETTISDSAEIEVVSDTNTQANSGTKKIMASLFSDLPEYLSFLFRVFVTIVLLLFLANLSLVILPRRN